MAKPTYEELEKRICGLTQRLSQMNAQEDRPCLDLPALTARELAHDLNNILSGIMAHLSLLSLSSDSFSLSQKKHVQNSMDAVKKGAKAIGQFQRQFSRSPCLKAPIDSDGVAEEDSRPVIQGGTETILVVEDDDSVRESIKTALEDCGYNVIVAEDGEQGIALFKENCDTINAVLLDMVMPKMSGKEVFRQMLELSPDVRVIISSGQTDSWHTDPILESAKNFLSKPFEIDVLEDMLRQVLDDA